LQETHITRRVPEAACWLRLGCWSNNSANSHPIPGAFNRRVLLACLVPQWSYLPHRPRHQRRFTIVTGCLRPTPADNLPILTGIQPAGFRHSGATLSPARRAMESGHLLHSVLTHPSSANARHLKSRHPFVPVAEHLISSSDNNMHAAHWVDHQWNTELADNPQHSAFSSPTLAPTHPE